MPKHPHILNAASNLLGIALVIITGLNVSKVAHRSFADEVAWEYFQKHGLRALFKKSVHKIQNIQDDYDYNEWYKKVRITDEELAKQRESAGDFAQQPTFSIVIPVYATPEKFLRRMLDSIREQTYPKFEVCLVDATPYAKIQHDPTQGRTPQEVLAEYAAADSRFRYETLTENLGIAENTNAAIRMDSPKRV